MSLNDDKTRHAQNNYRVLVPHWEAAIDGKVLWIVQAPDREAARATARRKMRNYLYLTPVEQKRVTVRYLCNK